MEGLCSASRRLVFSQEPDGSDRRLSHRARGPRPALWPGGCMHLCSDSTGTPLQRGLASVFSLVSENLPLSLPPTEGHLCSGCDARVSQPCGRVVRLNNWSTLIKEIQYVVQFCTCQVCFYCCGLKTFKLVYNQKVGG